MKFNNCTIINNFRMLVYRLSCAVESNLPFYSLIRTGYRSGCPTVRVRLRARVSVKVRPFQIEALLQGNSPAKARVGWSIDNIIYGWSVGLKLKMKHHVTTISMAICPLQAHLPALYHHTWPSCLRKHHHFADTRQANLKSRDFHF